MTNSDVSPAQVALAARKRRQRHQKIMAAAGAVLIVVVSGWLLLRATQEATGCGALPPVDETQATAVQLVLELQGNTPKDAERISTFVSSQLEAMTGDVAESFDVRVSFVRYGAPVDPDGCLSTPRRIASPEQDLEVFNSDRTSDDNRKVREQALTETRKKQIGWISAEVGSQVQQVSFEGLNPADPALSPRFVWQAAMRNDSADSYLAVYTPLLSTVDDCLTVPPSGNAEAVTVQSTADELVGGCLRFKQISTSQASRTAVVVDATLLDASQREWSIAIGTALCQQATQDKCSAMPETN